MKEKKRECLRILPQEPRNEVSLIVLDKVFGEVYYLYLDHLGEAQIFVRRDFGPNTFHCFFASLVEDTKEQDYFICQQVLAC